MPGLTTEDALLSVGERLVADTIESQRRKSLVDQGKSARSTKAVISASRSIKILRIVGAKHWRYQQNGRGSNRSRRPGKDMVDALKAWAVRHGMPESAGWPIAIKIAREGVQVPNLHNPGGVLSEPLNLQRVKGLVKAHIRPVLIDYVRSTLFR